MLHKADAGLDDKMWDASCPAVPGMLPTVSGRGFEPGMHALHMLACTLQLLVAAAHDE
jgi:hypothetical protein